MPGKAIVDHNRPSDEDLLAVSAALRALLCETVAHAQGVCKHARASVEHAKSVMRDCGGRTRRAGASLASIRRDMLSCH